MILIVSKEERELITRLRTLGSQEDSTPALTAEVLALKRQIVDLEISKSKKEEDFERRDRELRHMIGLEKKRQEVEITQAKKETELTVREGNLAEEKKRFEEQLKFNTERFQTMEVYLKDMMGNILDRLPNISMDIKRREKVNG